MCSTTPPVRVLRLLALLLLLLPVVGCQSVPGLRRQAERATEAGRHERAQSLLDRAADRAPTDWRTRYKLGRVLLERGRYDRAADELGRAAALYGSGAWRGRIVDQYAAALWKADRTDRLRKVLRHEADAGDGARPYLRQARYLERIGDMDAALLSYRKAVRFAPPGTVAAHLRAATFLESIGRSQRALEMLRVARSRAPDNPRVRRRLAERGADTRPAR